MKDFRDRTKCNLSSEHKPACPKPCTAPLSTLLFWREKGFRLSQMVAYCKNLKLKPPLDRDNVPVHCLLFFAFSPPPPDPEYEDRISVQAVFWSKEKIFSRYFLHVQIIIRVLKYFLEMEKRCSSVLLGITEKPILPCWPDQQYLLPEEPTEQDQQSLSHRFSSDKSKRADMTIPSH